jgi:hypothetical protein
MSRDVLHSSPSELGVEMAGLERGQDMQATSNQESLCFLRLTGGESCLTWRGPGSSEGKFTTRASQIGLKRARDFLRLCMGEFL